MDVSAMGEGDSEREDNVRMIAESAAGILKNDRARARLQRFENDVFDTTRWAELADQGWLMTRVPEARDGMGLGISELCTISRALGRALTPEPIAMAAVIAPALPDDDLAGLLSCQRVVLPAFAQSRGPQPSWNGTALSGRTELLPMARAADAFLVETVDGAALVEREARGVAIEIHPTHDGSHVGCVVLDNAEPKPVTADVQKLRTEATLVLSAQLVGIAETAFDITMAYLKDRSQFGRPIGSFQSLQHRAVDMYIELSLAAASVEAAASAVDDGARGPAVQKAVSLAKARATKSVNHVTREAIQFHGGIGYTDEADIGLFLRKAMTLSGLLGTEEQHRQRLLELTEAENG